MKKQLLLSLALGLTGASPLLAGTVDVYITGSTAFRANVYTACTKLFQTPPNIYYGDAAHGVGSTTSGSKAQSWAMTGTPTNTLTALAGNTLVIHGLFTGSIEGLQTVETASKLIFPLGSGTSNGGTTSGYVTNTPTIGFSDAGSVSTPYPASSSFNEDAVCVQPFILCKSQAATGAVTNINNVTWEQLKYGIGAGRIPLSAWTYKITDTNNYVYLLQRTKDSGTRRTETAQTDNSYNNTVGIYLYDVTNNVFYTPSGATAWGLNGGAPCNVIGSEGVGNNNANLAWSYGYIGGGDIKTALNVANSANQALAYLSISDGQSVGSSNWAAVVSYNGVWPTAAGIGIRGNTGTNDFSPITLGYYPCWGVEVAVYPVNPASAGDQDITQSQLGTSDNTYPGSFMSVFNAQSFNNNGVVTVGSIENEIVASQPTGATAIRLSDMVNSRAAVGGTIFPLFP